MDGMYGINPSTGSDDYADKALLSPENLMIAAEYGQYHYDSMVPSGDYYHRNIPVFESAEELGFQCSVVSESASVGAPPEIARLLDEIRRDKDLSKQDAVSMCLGVDPELDEFMETYCDILVKYKTDLSRPFDEATSFLNKIETQLVNLCKGKSKP
ncbi:UNVERIFIED_CONTAM: Homeobox protein knotted-1-like 6 [Sesamum calycinum]|uniref:Homeobox protein knotted-1-like 6 n=1 Tax=Sesamum calycinum TaxID=2727403 RepID=A0AAW2QYG1_9LAMI